MCTSICDWEQLEPTLTGWNDKTDDILKLYCEHPKTNSQLILAISTVYVKPDKACSIHNGALLLGDMSFYYHKHTL